MNARRRRFGGACGIRMRERECTRPHISDRMNMIIYSDRQLNARSRATTGDFRLAFIVDDDIPCALLQLSLLPTTAYTFACSTREHQQFSVAAGVVWF